MLMERNAEIIRGWPYDGSLERVEPIKAGSTLQNGDWVIKQADGSVDKVGATASNAVGLVIVGNGDSGSAANSGKCVVLWGNFLAKISNFAAGSYTAGQLLTVKNGVVTGATGASSTGNPVTAIVFGDPVIGYVLDVVAASAGLETAHITIKVA